MIKYQLICSTNHEFEGWFRNSADYDDQAGNGLLSCPICGTDSVTKAIMAPAISKGKSVKREQTGPKTGASDGQLFTPDANKLAAIKDDIIAAAQRAREYVEKNFDYVGEDFPEEARRIHYGEGTERNIYGEATGKEVKDLVEEGVEIAPLPTPKELDIDKKKNKKKLN